MQGIETDTLKKWINEMPYAVRNAWKQMQETATTEAQRLVDEFPDHQHVTLGYPVKAAHFCNAPAPTDLNRVMIKQQTLKMFTAAIASQRMALQMRASDN